MIDDRQSGLWVRALTAGVAPYQFVLSHLVIGTGIMVIQSVEFIVYAHLVVTDPHRWSFIVVVPLLIFLVGLSGILFGLVISILSDSTLLATTISTVVAFPFILISGKQSWTLRPFNTNALRFFRNLLATPGSDPHSTIHRLPSALHASRANFFETSLQPAGTDQPGHLSRLHCAYLMGDG